MNSYRLVVVEILHRFSFDLLHSSIGIKTGWYNVYYEPNFHQTRFLLSHTLTVGGISANLFHQRVPLLSPNGHELHPLRGFRSGTNYNHGEK